MRKRLIGLAVGTAALALGVPAGAVERGSVGDVQKLEQQNQGFIDAWNNDDASGMASVFAADADLINPFGDRAQGRAQITALFQREHSGPLQKTIMTQNCEAPRFLSPTVVSVTCPYAIKSAPGSGRNVDVRGTLTRIESKRGGRWMVDVARPMIPAQMPSMGAPPPPTTPGTMPSR